MGKKSMHVVVSDAKGVAYEESGGTVTALYAILAFPVIFILYIGKARVFEFNDFSSDLSVVVSMLVSVSRETRK
jgi:hypothetical protein